MGFTKHSGTPENKTYERLRKRSYRRIDDWNWHYEDHTAYVAGLHDAIFGLSTTRTRLLDRIASVYSQQEYPL